MLQARGGNVLRAVVMGGSHARFERKPLMMSSKYLEKIDVSGGMLTYGELVIRNGVGSVARKWVHI